MSLNRATDQQFGPNLTRGFRNLGEDFYSEIRLAPLQGTQIVQFNTELAKHLGFDTSEQSRETLRAIFNGEQALGNDSPIASLYAGHQFGVWVSQLGDGRAALIAEVAAEDGQSWEIQSKGGGPTPYSRHGDGRAVLRSSIREYLCSEAMHALGVPTTRALALLDSNTPVYRESRERGAILIRAAESHIRFGHFEVFASREQFDQVRTLADYLIDHFFPHLGKTEQPYLALYQEVIRRTAWTLAKWQALGFCHGVMNSDNMSALGLTIDYGPFGFLEQFNPGYICNHSDHGGRYSYENQPLIAQWNLACLGNAMLSLLDVEQAQAALESYQEEFARARDSEFAAKLGLQPEHPGLTELLNNWLLLLEKEEADFTRSFRLLTDLCNGSSEADEKLDSLLGGNPDWRHWLKQLQQAQCLESGATANPVAQMAAANPQYILRNSFAQRAIEEAEAGRYQELERLHRVLKNPYQEQAGAEDYEQALEGYGDIPVSCSS